MDEYGEEGWCGLDKGGVPEDQSVTSLSFHLKCVGVHAARMRHLKEGRSRGK